MPRLIPAERRDVLGTDLAAGYAMRQARAEASRCTATTPYTPTCGLP